MSAWEQENILCVIYRGQPTHHLITTNDNGFLVVNGKQYGEATTLQAVHVMIGTHAGVLTTMWEVPLYSDCPIRNSLEVNVHTLMDPLLLLVFLCMLQV